MSEGTFRGRVTARARRAQIELTSAFIDRLELYWSLLARWNQKINLTALPLEDFPDRTIDRLLVEPLLAARLVAESPIDWYDLGSGGGSPAIPMKIARPHARLTMVEARARKAAFLREAVRTLDLADTTVESRRFEELADSEARRPADLVTMRAVRFDGEAAATCGRLLKPGGILLLFASAAPVLPGDGPMKLLRTVLFEATSSSVHVLERV